MIHNALEADSEEEEEAHQESREEETQETKGADKVQEAEEETEKAEREASKEEAPGDKAKEESPKREASPPSFPTLRPNGRKGGILRPRVKDRNALFLHLESPQDPAEIIPEKPPRNIVESYRKLQRRDECWPFQFLSFLTFCLSLGYDLEKRCEGKGKNRAI